MAGFGGFKLMEINSNGCFPGSCKSLMLGEWEWLMSKMLQTLNVMKHVSVLKSSKCSCTWNSSSSISMVAIDNKWDVYDIATKHHGLFRSSDEPMSQDFFLTFLNGHTSSWLSQQCSVEVLKNWPWFWYCCKISGQKWVSLTPSETNMTMESPTIWRCISYIFLSKIVIVHGYVSFQGVLSLFLFKITERGNNLSRCIVLHLWCHIIVTFPCDILYHFAASNI